MKRFKRYLAKTIRILLRLVITIIDDELEQFRGERSLQRTQQLLDNLQSCGSDVRIKGTVHISYPENCIIGNNVHIGNNAAFATGGGLVIGDNTHISRNVSIYTGNHNYVGGALPYDDIVLPKPVLIGRNVWIGINVSITPGVQIGDGAIIGMGTTVSSNVPPLAIVGSAPQRILKYRDKLHYEQLDHARLYGGVSGQLLSGETISRFRKSGQELEDKLFFVLTTGRSGSTSVAETLSLHPEITCAHQPRTQMIRLSTEYAHGLKDQAQVQAELESHFYTSGTLPDTIYGESDQKYFNLVHLLHELLPKCKFLWLLRDGRDVVASAYGRSWYDPDKSARSHPIKRSWAWYRLDGEKCGVCSPEQWQNMSAFERICWYWGYVNNELFRQLQDIHQDQWMYITLEGLDDQLDHVLTFLGARPQDLRVKHSNKATYPVRRWREWNGEMMSAFETWCGPLMDRFYPEWRTDWDDKRHHQSTSINPVDQ